MNYYIADTHFGHENVLKFDKRPFRSVDEMDEVLITNWNTVVKDTDDVYIIGEFIYKSKKSAIWYLKRLKGKKHLIQGNHDSFLLKDESLLKEFESIDKMTYTKDGTYTIVLCHFPIAEWNQYWRGSWHIYGHIHNQKKGCFDFMIEKDRALNAGCMINHYAPVTIEQLIENNRTYKKNCWYELCREKKKFIGEREIDDIMSKYYKTALIYHFNIAGKRDHEHSFSAVLRAAYGSKGLFEISEADRQEYSEQELNLLKSLLEKMREDGKGDV